jgi:hypothetical protein
MSKQEEKKEVNTSPIYLRLLGIFEADVQVTETEHVNSFLFDMATVDGQEFLCPMCCPEEFKPLFRSHLGKLTPLCLYVEENKKDGKGSSEIVNVHDMGKEETH